MVKLVDTPDLGSGAARRGGSSPSTRTNWSLRLSVRTLAFQAKKGGSIPPGTTITKESYEYFINAIFCNSRNSSCI